MQNEQMRRLAERLEKVIQLDRDAAADLIAWHNNAAAAWHTNGGNDLRFFAADMPAATRNGTWDEHPVVQYFARHRIAALRSRTGDQSNG